MPTAPIARSGGASGPDSVGSRRGASGGAEPFGAGQPYAGLGPGKEGRAAMAVVTTRQLLESGVHFGHQTRRWNPKMKRFIFTERNGIYIIDLQQSLTYIDRAY